MIGTAAGLAQVVRERPQERAREAETVTGFLVGVLEPTQPDGTRRDVRELLDEASTDVSAFAERPGVDARVRRALGVTYLEFGRLDEAEELLGTALDGFTRTLGTRGRPAC